MFTPATSRASTMQTAPCRPTRVERKRHSKQTLPLRIARTPHDSPRAPQSDSWLDRVIAIVSDTSFASRRSSRSSSLSPGASCPPTPGLETEVAWALLSQRSDDANGTTRKAYEHARLLTQTTSQEYTNLVNDMWVDPSTGLKASCLTHALMSGNQAVADLLESHGAEESYVLMATPAEILLAKQNG